MSADRLSKPMSTLLKGNPRMTTPTATAPTADTPEGADTPDVYTPYDPSPSLDPIVGRRFPAECDYCAAYAIMRPPVPGVYWLATVHSPGCPALLEEGNEATPRQRHREAS